MTEKQIPIKEVRLNNNCPVCYSKKGLILTFKQTIVENSFYKSITSDITNTIECDRCKTTIYPVQWTDEIERVFEYHQKTVVPKKTSTYLKKKGWIIIVAVVLIALTILILTIYPNL
jgi:hypothetical protein